MPMAYLRRPMRVSIDLHQANANAPDQGGAIMQKRGILPSPDADFHEILRMREAKISAQDTRWL
jgi:hypothetical protein